MVEVGFDTGSVKGCWPILEPAMLKTMKLSMNDIDAIKSTYFSVPGYLYEEKPTASFSHPLEGSIGVFFLGKDNIERSIEYIFFYDFNLRGNHYRGRPHHNTQPRLNDGHNTQMPSKVQGSISASHHIIPDSPHIRIMLMDNGKIVEEKMVKRVPLSYVRQRK